jgi:protein involved in polysaccharide export with SLBB domain
MNQEPAAPAPATEGKKVCVVGGVVKPKEVRFKNRLTVTEAINEAGGLSGRKGDIEVVVISGMAGEARSRLIYVDLKGAMAKKPFRDLELQDFDLVYVAPLRKDRVNNNKSSANECPSWPVLKGIGL